MSIIIIFAVVCVYIVAKQRSLFWTSNIGILVMKFTGTEAGIFTPDSVLL